MERKGNVFFRLRPGLRFIPAGSARRPRFIIEDPIRNQYFRIGAMEYNLLTCLEQARSLDELQALLDRSPGDRFEPDQVQQILGWLHARQLIQGPESANLNEHLDREREARAQARLQRLNLISFKIPLGNPDPILSRIAPRCGWLTGPVFSLAWILGALVSLTLLIGHWSEFRAQTTGFFSPVNMLYLWLIWSGLKVLHETYHALVCYRYGGRIYEAGILFILFIPLTYVDATSSWRFSSRWQRIHVDVAGIMAELAVAWSAICIWTVDPLSTAGFLAHRTVLVAGISSLLFNANPLMRFDGYYVLSDLLELPNLYQVSLTHIKRLLARIFFGLPYASPPEPVQERPIFITGYGLAVFLWRFLVLASLAYMASTLFGGLGILITLTALVAWTIPLLHQLIRFWSMLREHTPHLRKNLIIRGVLLVGVLLLGCLTIGTRHEVTAPAVVVFGEQARIKSAGEGFVKTIFVRDGEQVRKGQKLILLENERLDEELNEIEWEIDQLRIKQRLARADHLFTRMQILGNQEQALRKKLQDIRERIRNQVIIAPESGQVLARRLAWRQGTYVTAGTELLWIVSPEKKKLIASFAQKDLDDVSRLIGQPVTVDLRTNGLGTWKGTLRKISPTASNRLEEPGLAARYGGPLDVYEQRIMDTEPGEETITLILFSPRFTAEIALPAPLLHEVKAGQLATIRLPGRKIYLWEKVRQLAGQWMKKKEQAAAARQRASL